jgi:S1-C subfamily serine protease
MQPLGLELGWDPEQPNLVKINSLIAGSTAAVAGLKHGDILTDINGENITGHNIQDASTLRQYAAKVYQHVFLLSYTYTPLALGSFSTCKLRRCT